MARSFLPALCVTFCAFLLGGNARADAVTSGVVTAVTADSFSLRVRKDRVLVLHPDQNVVRGHNPRVHWDPKKHGGAPSPELSFAALRPGMRVSANYHFDRKDHSRTICTLVTKEGSSAPEADPSKLKDKVKRLEKEIANLKEENAILRAKLGLAK